jgi:hypothetical protein
MPGLNIQTEFIVAQIVTRYLNETIRRYGLTWIGCPIQEKLETVVERKIVDLATNFELLHFPKLIQLGNWFSMESNNLAYPDLRKMLLQEINNENAVLAVSKLETLLELLSWGGLQAVRAIARNNSPPGLTLEIKDLLTRLIREEFFDWWLYEGGWVIRLRISKFQILIISNFSGIHFGTRSSVSEKKSRAADRYR